MRGFVRTVCSLFTASLLFGLDPAGAFAAVSAPAAARLAALRASVRPDMRLAARSAELAAATSVQPGPMSSSPVATDAAGFSYVAWQDNRSLTGMGLLVQKFDAAGTPQWNAAGVMISMSIGYEQGWQVLPDQDGGVYVVWEDDRTEDMSDRNIYLQHVEIAGVVTGPDNGVAVCSFPHSQNDFALTSDGADGIFVVWTDDRAWTHTDIYAQHYSGTAESWTQNGVLVCGASGSQSGPEAVADGAGGVFITWTDNRLGDTAGKVYAQRLTSGGTASWAANGVSVSPMDGDHFSAVVATDGSGGAFLSWLTYTLAETIELRAERLDTSGVAQWGGDVTVCASPGVPSWARIVEDGEGGAIIAWQDYRSGGNADVYAQRVTWGGVTMWADNGVQVSADSSEQTWLTIASDGAHGAIVAWRNELAGYIAEMYAQRVDSAGTLRWGPGGTAVCTVQSSKAHLSLCATPSGGAVVTWSDTRSRVDLDVYAQRLDADGVAQWTAQGMTVQSVARQTSPLVVATGGGGSIVLWLEKRLGEYDIRARKQDGSGNPLWSARGVCTAPDLQTVPAAVSDGAGGVIVTWMDYRNGTGQPDIYAQRMTSDGDAAWTLDGVPVCTASGAQFFPALVTDGAGGAIIVWQDDRLGSSDIYAQRLDAGGSALWAMDGAVICDTTDNQQFPVAVSDGAGGAILSWEHSAGEGGGTVRVQRVNAAGAIAWATGGELAVTTDCMQSAPAIVGDGEGGAIVVWQDQRSGPVGAYAQRFRSVGIRAWGEQGVRLCTQTADQMWPVAVANTAGGAFFVWSDLRDGFEYDIYAQKVDSAGAIGWNANGVVVCNNGGHQFMPAAISDEAGGLIAAWSDLRNGLWFDAYAQRLNSLGQVRWTTDGAALSTAAYDQLLPELAPDGSGGAIMVWEDERTDALPVIFAQRYNTSGVAQWTGGGLVPAWISLSRSEATPESARLEWYAADAAQLVATVYRREEGGDWQALGTLNGDGSGLFVYDDRAITPGRSYGYRLGVVQNGLERFTSESWVEVPLRARFAFAGSWPNPSVGELRVAFSLRGGAPARLELLDIAGRHVRAWDISGAGAGSHVRTLADARGMAPGVYVLRLTEGAVHSNRRVTIMR